MSAVVTPTVSELTSSVSANAVADEKSRAADTVSGVTFWPELPCEVAIEIPVATFTVDDLLKLAPGSLIATDWKPSAEIPLHANGQLIGLVEFAPVGDRLSFRISELK